MWIVDPASKAVSATPVEVDSYSTGRLLLRSGVKPGALVVTAGGQLLSPGEIVARVIETASSKTPDVKP